jgi:hypothetical protein
VPPIYQIYRKLYTQNKKSSFEERPIFEEAAMDGMVMIILFTVVRLVIPFAVLIALSSLASQLNMPARA